MKQKQTKQILAIMMAYSLSLLVAALLAGPVAESFRGFLTILQLPSQLTLDYFKVGTVGGTFLNAGLVGLACVLVFRLSKADLSGTSLMAFFLTIGFSFFGMNFLNIWPCMLGVWLFTRITQTPFASQVNVAVFATSLSPFVSEAIFRNPFFEGFLVGRILMGLLLGIVAGFLMAILCQHSPNLHRGYTLYNAAAVAGFIGIMLFSIMFRATGHEIPDNTDIGEGHDMVVYTYAIATSIAAIAAGFFMNGNSFKGYSTVLRATGRRCDFPSLVGVPITLVNIGVFGLFSTGYYALAGASMTGPTAGSIVCLLAIAPCGAHVRNMLPIMLGYALASTFCAFTLSTQAIVVGLCFAGALVPISGCFGSLYGVLAGMLHACMVTTVVTFHGGLCLYNGGFTCGLVAILLAPTLEYFYEPSQELTFLPKIKKT